MSSTDTTHRCDASTMEATVQAAIQSSAADGTTHTIEAPADVYATVHVRLFLACISRARRIYTGTIDLGDGPAEWSVTVERIAEERGA